MKEALIENELKALDLKILWLEREASKGSDSPIASISRDSLVSAYGRRYHLIFNREGIHYE